MRILGRKLPTVWVSVVLSLAWFAPRLFAGAEENEETGKQLMFLPPPVEGLISLGVYDTHGKLVRVLKQAAEVDSFKSGLNGLFVDWDGADVTGKAVSAGKYFACGVLIGDVNISGVAYHLNDWVDDAQNLRVKTISSPALLGGRSLAVLADTGHQEILIIDTASMKPQRFSMDPGIIRLKADGANLLAIYSDHIASIAIPNGTVTETNAAPNVRDADRSGSNWAIVTDRDIQCKITDQKTTIALPTPDITRCALLGTS